MKDGWQTKKIGEMCTLMTGGTPSRSKPEYFGGDIKWLVSGDIHQREIFDCEGRITQAGMKGSNARLLPVNSVLVALNGQGRTRGTVALLRTPATCNQSLVSISPKDSIELLPEYLYANLHARYQELRRMTGDDGNDRRGLNMALIRDIEVPVAPLSEQRRIVSLIDEAFGAIATAKTYAEKNLQNAGALFESHLQSVFTQRDKVWVEKSVGELVSEGALLKPFDGNHGEIHPRKSDYTESGVPFIMASDLQNGSVDTENCKFISRKLADSLRVGFAKDGDVLISHKGTIGRSAIVSTRDDYIMLTPQVTSYRVKDASKLFNRFVRYYFMSPVFQREMIAGAEDGATRAYIGITKQLTLRFRLPPLEEQRKIAAKLDALEPETQRLESIYRKKIAGLEALKESLLHQAFTGQLGVRAA